MSTSKHFLETETSYGKVMLENYRSSNHPFSLGLTDVSQNTYQGLLYHAMSINKLGIHTKFVKPEDKFVQFPCNHHYTLGGWHLNGNILTKKISGVETVHDLLVHYLDKEWAFKDLTFYHRAIIAEIVHKHIPEEILKNPKKFDIMLQNRTFYEER